MNEKDWRQEYLNLLNPKTGHEIGFEEALNLKVQNMPSAFYKYRSCDDIGLNIISLELQSEWLADPTTFNDPYDSSLSINTNRLGNEHLRQNVGSLINQFASGLGIGKKEIEKISQSSFPAEDLFILIASKDKDFQHLEANSIKKEVGKVMEKFIGEAADRFTHLIKSGLKICSFSERNDSVLMWSHYAQNHTGFCVEYDFRFQTGEDPRLRMLHPVIYQMDIFDSTEYLIPIDPKPTVNIMLPTLAAIHKSPDWQYEKEWRLVLSIGNWIIPNPYPMPTPIGIYLGSRIAKDSEARILEIGKQKTIPVYTMKLDANRFQMQAERLL